MDSTTGFSSSVTFSSRDIPPPYENAYNKKALKKGPDKKSGLEAGAGFEPTTFGL
jgi:hypothetical protein